MFKLNHTLITLVLVFFVFSANAQTANRYTISVDGQEVKDNKTQLIWRRCPWGMTWSVNLCHGTAATYTHEEALASYSDDTVWRLPNVKELSSIVDRNHSNPAIDTLIFPATPSSMFWSSTPSSTDANNAWHVDFYGGNVGVSVRYDNLMVRLVRGGQ
jgi:hypothetical protein